MLRVFFSRRWWWTTLLVIAAVGAMVRLGLWQVDRFGQRKALNAELGRHLQAPPLTLEAAHLNSLAAPLDLLYRSVVVRGQYDHSQEIALINQIQQSAPGVHLITPLVIEGSDRAVLVDRGWIPYADSAPYNWAKYAEPGLVEVRGMIWLSDDRLRGSARAVADPRWWFRVDVEQMQEQVSYPLLPFYIKQLPDPSLPGLPLRVEPVVNLSAARHIHYVIFWFSLAAMTGIGYVRLVRSTRLSTPAEKRAPRPTADAGYRVFAEGAKQ